MSCTSAVDSIIHDMFPLSSPTSCDVAGERPAIFCEGVRGAGGGRFHHTWRGSWRRRVVCVSLAS